MTAPPSSYGQILRASSISGAAQAVTFLLSLVRTKLTALILGPTGLGLVSVYLAVIDLAGTLLGLGLSASAVRDIAIAHAAGNASQLARTVRTLRRLSCLTGLAGWIACVALAWSAWTVASANRPELLALLGATLFLGSLAAAQNALLQGTRRLADLARVAIGSAIAATFLAGALYPQLGPSGIPAVLILSALANLGLSRWFARKVRIRPVPLSWGESFRHGGSLVQVGIAFSYGTVLAGIVSLAIRACLVTRWGLEAAGMFHAAWGISAFCAASITQAMATDFFPRLSAVAGDNARINQLVNEQIEIGLLLAIPGLVGTLAFARPILGLVYSSSFLEGSRLVPWFILGTFGQVILFPLGHIQRAKGASRWMFLSQSWANLSHAAFAFGLIRRFGPLGAALAYALCVCGHFLLVLFIARRLAGFAWSRTSIELIAISSVLLAAACAGQLGARPFLSAVVLGAACWMSLRGLLARLGPHPSGPLSRARALRCLSSVHERV